MKDYQRPPWRKMAEGIYLNFTTSQAVFVEWEVLRACDMEDTPDNRALVREVVNDLCKEMNVPVPVLPWPTTN